MIPAVEPVPIKVNPILPDPVPVNMSVVSEYVIACPSASVAVTPIPDCNFF